MDYKTRVFSLFQLVGIAAMDAFAAVAWERGQTEMAVIGTVVVLCVVAGVWRSRSNVSRKLGLMLEAIVNEDYSFRFPARGKMARTNGYLNSVLNRYAEQVAKTHHELAAHESFNELVMENVHTGIVVLDERCNVVRCNSMALTLLGLSAFSRLAQLERYGHEIVECFRSMEPHVQRQLAFKTAQGQKDLWINVSLLQMEQRQLRVFTLNDIRNVMDENELDAWIKLSHVLTHEIMNAITPVASLSASLLSKDTWSTEQLREGLSVIYTTSQGLLSFVDNYRKFTSLPRPVPVLFYVQELTDELRTLLLVPERIKLEFHLVPEDLLIYADKHLIRQVLINLVRNAIQAIGEGDGCIRVVAFVQTDERVLIKVSNDGTVIPEEIRSHIFVPFFTTKERGSGIGLSVSRQIMMASGGSLSLLPAGTAGWNTTFVLEFP